MRWQCGLLVEASLEQPEDADHPFTVHERCRADLHGHPRAGGRDQDGRRLRGRGGAEHLLGEQLAGAPAVLGRDNGGEVSTANIADESLGCRIDPPDDSRLVEHVARDADVLQSLLDVAADFQAGGHHASVADLRAARHPWRRLARPLFGESLAQLVERTTGPTLARVICYGRRLRPPRPTRSRGGFTFAERRRASGQDQLRRTPWSIHGFGTPGSQDGS